MMWCVMFEGVDNNGDPISFEWENDDGEVHSFQTWTMAYLAIETYLNYPYPEWEIVRCT